MRLVMMGTGPFGVPTFRRLYEAGHAIAALVTAPLKQRGKRPAPIRPIRQIAQEHGIEFCFIDAGEGSDLAADRICLTGDIGQAMAVFPIVANRPGFTQSQIQMKAAAIPGDGRAGRLVELPQSHCFGARRGDKHE